jgi:hypothetical protein
MACTVTLAGIPLVLHGVHNRMFDFSMADGVVVLFFFTGRRSKNRLHDLVGSRLVLQVEYRHGRVLEL